MSLPSSLLAQPGQIPSWGQAAWYKFEDGTELPAMITWVDSTTSPDGKYVNVAAWLIHPQKAAHNGGFRYSGWLFEIATAKILYIPCGPPYP